MSSIPGFANTDIDPDVIWCINNNKDYLPVVFPGSSWHNMHPIITIGSDSKVGREFSLAVSIIISFAYKAKMLYQAMFDEMNEGTQIFKCTNDPPVGASSFVTYEGLPSDQYLWLVGQGDLMLNNEIPLSSTLPTRPSGVNKQGKGSPGKYKLEQNYPNPFNPVTTISYQLAAASRVNLTIYNVLGEKIATLVNEAKTPGRYEVKFDASRLASGIYFYHLATENYSETKELVLIK